VARCGRCGVVVVGYLFAVDGCEVAIGDRETAYRINLKRVESEDTKYKESVRLAYYMLWKKYYSLIMRLI
jgi:hypothetical protein